MLGVGFSVTYSFLNSLLGKYLRGDVKVKAFIT